MAEVLRIVAKRLSLAPAAPRRARNAPRPPLQPGSGARVVFSDASSRFSSPDPSSSRQALAVTGLTMGVEREQLLADRQLLELRGASFFAQLLGLVLRHRTSAAFSLRPAQSVESPGLHGLDAPGSRRRSPSP
jgi:hypothetical protein